MTLQELFSAQSCAHFMHTQYQLAMLKKGIESIMVYYHKVKALATLLGAVGKTLTHYELPVYLLVGLGTDFDSLITFITTRSKPLTLY